MTLGARGCVLALSAMVTGRLRGVFGEGATDMFVTLGASGRFLAFPPMVSGREGLFFDLGQIAVFWCHPYVFCALMVSFAILGRWLFSCFSRYVFRDFELGPILL